MERRRERENKAFGFIDQIKPRPKPQTWKPNGSIISGMEAADVAMEAEGNQTMLHMALVTKTTYIESPDDGGRKKRNFEDLGCRYDVSYLQ